MWPENKLKGKDYPRGPDGLAQCREERIVELEAHKATLRTRAEKRPVNRELHLLRGMLDWCKARAGYVEKIHG